MEKKRILIVEDEPSIANNIEKDLSEYDCVKIARMEKLKEANFQDYDLILLDKEIKGGNAWEWMNEQISEGKRFPQIILLSVYQIADTRERYANLKNFIEVCKRPAQNFFDRVKETVNKKG